MAKTAINTIKNWFKTGLKPTQDQFWNWMDSFWHKDELIPQDKIQDLSTTLSGKADADQLANKANADATGLTDEQKSAWKEALSVREVPANIALVDKLDKEGNVYSKEQVTELLDDLDKNIGNSDLQVPAGTVRTLNVTGAKLQVQGLENKKTDASFNKKIKINDAGEMAYSDEADITLNIPENFTGQPSVGSMTITVNHIYPNQIPERPVFADELKNIMAEYNNIVFTPINQGDLVIKTKENKGLGTNKTYTDGSFSLDGSDSAFNPYVETEEVVNITAPGVLLPNDKNWILKISGNIKDILHGGNIFAGVCRGEGSPVTHGISTGQYTSINLIGNERLRVGDDSRNNFLCLIVKTGGVITTMVYQGGKSIFFSLNAFTELGNYIPKISLCKASAISARMSYKILD